MKHHALRGPGSEAAGPFFCGGHHDQSRGADGRHLEPPARRERLMAFLRKSIELKEPIYCSL
jgi:hypothetical protein